MAEHTHAPVRDAAGSSAAPDAAPDAAWQERLRASGHRLTAQRQLVLEAVAALGHATPEEVCSRVRETAQGVNISTVYRNLELLEELGLVAHAHLRHGAPTYHATSEAPHVHLTCSRCGGIESVSPDVVADVIERLGNERGFSVDVRHVTFSGLCRGCAA